MEKFSNQNLKEVKDILKNGNLSITKNSNLTYDKLNIIYDSKYRILFLRSLICAIDSENRDEIGILTNITNIGRTKVKTTYIAEKDIDKVIMNICDDIFAASRFSIHWENRPKLIYVIDIPDNNYHIEKYIERLNKVVNVASQLNIMIILGSLAYLKKYKEYCNILDFAYDPLPGHTDSFLNGDEIKIIDNQLFVEENNEEEPITFETYGYHKVVDDEFWVVYERPKDNSVGRDVIEINKKVYRYTKYYVDINGNSGYNYILEHEDRLIHNLLDIFKRFRMLDENKTIIKNIIEKKKIRLTQETIDNTDRTLKNLNINTDKKIFAVYCQDKKTDKKTYVAELQEDKTILFSDKPTGFDLRTSIYLTNELMNHYNIVGKEEIK